MAKFCGFIRWRTCILTLLFAAAKLTAVFVIRVEGLAPRHEEHWARTLNHTASVMVDNQRVGDVLGPLLTAHNFTFPRNALRKGVTYTGNNHRLRRAMHTLMAGGHADGRPFKVAVIGGSISWGHGSTRRGENDWFSLVSKWLMLAFPKVDILLRNGAIPMTTSGYMTMCLDVFTDNDTDIIFAEYNLNDGFQNIILDNIIVASFERLIRRVLPRGSHPAMVILQVPGDSVGKHENDTWVRPFHHGSEAVKAELAQYYDLPVLSFRSAVYRLAVFVKEPGFTWDQTMTVDGLHPADKGCELLRDLVVWLFQQTALDLLIHPFGPEDLELLADPLPKPMMPGNEVIHSSLCAQADGLRAFVRDNETHGFDFVNEGTLIKPRKGFMANTTGATLTLELDTWRGNGSTKGSTTNPVRVYLAHLRSYQHMGKVLARCVSGCRCKNRTIDGHHEERSSQLFLAVMEATQHHTCVISLVVLNASVSGEHKFRLGGLMLAEGSNGNFHIAEGAWMYAGKGTERHQAQVPAPTSVAAATGAAASGSTGRRASSHHRHIRRLRVL